MLIFRPYYFWTSYITELNKNRGHKSCLTAPWQIHQSNLTALSAGSTGCSWIQSGGDSTFNIRALTALPEQRGAESGQNRKLNRCVCHDFFHLSVCLFFTIPNLTISCQSLLSPTYQTLPVPSCQVKILKPLQEDTKCLVRYHFDRILQRNMH